MAAMTPMMMMQVAGAAMSAVSGFAQRSQAKTQARLASQQAARAAQIQHNNQVYAAQQLEHASLLALRNASLQRTRTTTAVTNAKRKSNETLAGVIAAAATAGATTASRGLVGLQVERDVLGLGLPDVYGAMENSIFEQLTGDYQDDLFTHESELRRNEARYQYTLADHTLQDGLYGAATARVAGKQTSQNALLSGVTGAAGSIGTGIYRQQQLGTPSTLGAVGGAAHFRATPAPSYL